MGTLQGGERCWKSSPWGSRGPSREGPSTVPGTGPLTVPGKVEGPSKGHLEPWQEYYLRIAEAEGAPVQGTLDLQRTGALGPHKEGPSP